MEAQYKYMYVYIQCTIIYIIILYMCITMYCTTISLTNTIGTAENVLIRRDVPSFQGKILHACTPVQILLAHVHNI